MNSNPRGAVLLCLLLAVGFFCIPIAVAYIYPTSFWALTDYEPVGLGDALNMAYRLGDRQFYYAQGLTNHPGVPFYFLSWFALALTGHPIASSGSSFYTDVLDHVEDYHVAIRTLGALVSAVGVFLVSRAALRVVPASVAVIGVLLWFVSTPASLETIVSTGNDSFAILVNALFFLVLIPLAYEEEVDPNLLVLAGFVGALAWLNKLSYIYVPIALYAAAFVKIVGSGIGWKRNFRLMTVYVISLLLVGYAAGYLVMGKQGMTNLYSFQTGVFWGTGLYGYGDQTIVSGSAVWHALNTVPAQHAYAVLIALIGGACVAIGGLLTGWKRPQHLPVAVISIGAGGAAAMSAVIVLKHYDIHYTSGVSATLPALVCAGYLLLQTWAPWMRIPGLIGSAVATVIMALGVEPLLTAQFEGQSHNSKVAIADLADIKKYLAGNERGVEWGYKAALGEYGEGSVVATASVPRLTYDYFRGRPKDISGALTHFTVRDIGVYVLSKGYFPTVDKIKHADNLSLLNLTDETKYQEQEGDKLIELRTVFLLIRGQKPGS